MIAIIDKFSRLVVPLNVMSVEIFITTITCSNHIGKGSKKDVEIFNGIRY